MKPVAPLVVTLFALASATVDCSSTPPAATAATTSAEIAARPTGALPVNATALRDDLRTALLDHATWMRLYIIDATGRLPSIDASAQRLRSSQVAIGNAVAPFYGPDAGSRLAGLLGDELDAARATIGAAMAHDGDAFARARGRWYESAGRVASFFAHESPFVSEDGLGVALRTWVSDDIGQTQARVAGAWIEDGADADGAAGQALAVADILTGALFQQFPHGVTPPTLDTKAESVHLVVRDLFHARATSMHEYVVERVARLPGAPVTMHRLEENANDIGRLLTHFYGGAFGDQLSGMLRTDLDHARATLDAALANDETAYGAAKKAWYENADLTAHGFAQKNARWSKHDLSLLFAGCIDATWNDVAARTRGNWAADVRAADALRSQSTALADAISTGLILERAL